MNLRKERRFKPEYAKELISIARGDFDSARGLRQIQMGRPENICYHAEQSIEKALKAVLCHLGSSVPLTHDLGTLSERISSLMPFPIGADLSFLNEFATSRRYEEGAMILEDEDLDAVIHTALEILEWAEKIVS